VAMGCSTASLCIPRSRHTNAWKGRGFGFVTLRIPGQGDRDSEVIPIRIPKLI